MINHSFVSAVADDPDNTIVQPSDWNAAHVIGEDGLTLPPNVSIPVISNNNDIAIINLPFATRPVLAAKSLGLGRASRLQTALGDYNGAAWLPIGGVSAAHTTLGSSPLTVTGGTATTRAVAATNILTRLRRLGHVSVATAGAIMTCTNTTPFVTTGTGTLGGFFFEATFVNSNAATVAGDRMWVGISNRTVAFTNVEPNTLTNGVGLAKLSTSNNLHLTYGGSVAQTAIDLGVNFPAAGLSTDAYRFIIYSPQSPADKLFWFVERIGTAFVASGELTGVVGTAIPANNTLMGFRFFKTNNATALAVGLDIGGVVLESLDRA